MQNLIRPGLRGSSKSEALAAEGDGLAVAVNLTHDTSARVRDYIKAQLPSVRTLLLASPTSKPGARSVVCGRHAFDLAESLAAQVKGVRETGGLGNSTFSLPRPAHLPSTSGSGSSRWDRLSSTSSISKARGAAPTSSRFRCRYLPDPSASRRTMEHLVSAHVPRPKCLIYRALFGCGDRI